MSQIMISCELVENEKPKCFASAAVYGDAGESESCIDLQKRMENELSKLICTRFRDTLAKRVIKFKNMPLEDISNIINAMIALGWIEINYDYRGCGD